jgi:phosphoribosylamine--glycine ligase
VFAVCDGERAVPLAPAQDFKRIGDGDTGPNTGGMGAYSPVPIAPPEVVDQVMDEAVEPTLAALRAEGIDYRGVLYAGLMLTAEGPKIIEYNVRFGDPETQVVLPLVAGGLTRSLWAVARGGAPTPIELVPGAASVTTVLASRGYPDTPAKGATITLPAQLPDEVTIFHAGTTRDPDGVLRVSGGRVLNITAVAGSFAEAQRLSRETAEAIRFEGKTYRRDIGWREAARLEGAPR